VRLQSRQNVSISFTFFCFDVSLRAISMFSGFFSNARLSAIWNGSLMWMIKSIFLEEHHIWSKHFFVLSNVILGQFVNNIRGWSCSRICLISFFSHRNRRCFIMIWIQDLPDRIDPCCRINNIHQRRNISSAIRECRRMLTPVVPILLNDGGICLRSSPTVLSSLRVRGDFRHNFWENSSQIFLWALIYLSNKQDGSPEKNR
jgi:hypothetical protein